jgi:hypothetical protein
MGRLENYKFENAPPEKRTFPGPLNPAPFTLTERPFGYMIKAKKHTAVPKSGGSEES